MSINPNTRSLCNPTPRLSEATQRSLLTGEIYDFKSRAAWLDSIRPGNFAEVVETYLLANQSLRADARKRDLLKIWAAIEDDRRGVILEQSTGRRSNRKADAREMLAQAFEQISRSGKGRKSARNGALSKGRAPRILTPEEMRACREEWFSVLNDTISDAMKEIVVRLGKDAPGRTYLYKLLGAPYAKRKK